jgi:hypothetical protein
LAPLVFTTEDEVLLQAARQLAIEAYTVGYGDAKLVRNPGSQGLCDPGGGCFIGTPAMGYFVLLKARYQVPAWTDSQSDLDAEFDWHQTTQAQELSEASARGLTTRPELKFLEF